MKALFLSTLFLLIACTALAQEPVAVSGTLPPIEINLDDLLPELQREIRGEDHTGLLWWMPSAYWMAAEGDNGLIDLFSRYTVVAAAVGRLDALSIEWVSEPELQRHITLRGRDGAHYAALEPPREAGMFSAVMKTVDEAAALEPHSPQLQALRTKYLANHAELVSSIAISNPPTSKLRPTAR